MKKCLTRVGAVALRQFYLLSSSPTRILPLFAWVVIDMVLWGFITKYLTTIASPGLNLVSVLLGAALFWDFFTRVMFGVTTAFLEDVWSRNFLNVFASPLTVVEYVLGLVLVSIGTSTVGLAIMVFVASVFFGLSFVPFGLVLVPFLLVLFLFGIALGIFGSALVLRFGPASEWLIWPIPALLSPLVGVFYPIATLPLPMQWFSLLLPPSYVFEGMRGVLSGHLPSAGPVLGAAVLASLYIVLAGVFFIRVFRASVRSGLLARYSAESVS